MIEVITLEKLRQEKQNYFIDLLNYSKFKIHYMWKERIFCSNTSYNYQDFCNIPCLFCIEKIEARITYYVDLLSFNSNYKIFWERVLLLSEIEYNLLKKENKILYLNSKNLKLEKIMSLIPKIKKNRTRVLKRITTYEKGIKKVLRNN